MGQLLCTRERAAQILDTATVTAEEARYLDNMLAAASSWIEAYCRRRFNLQRHDEVYDDPSDSCLLLRNYPIEAIEAVRYAPTVVLEVTNTTTTNQRATVRVTADGLELIRVASGTQSIDTTVTWASNATLSAVATAVVALGNGWTARVPNSNHGGLYSGDLWSPDWPVGARPCADSRYAGIPLHVEELGAFDVAARSGIIRLCSGYSLDVQSQIRQEWGRGGSSSDYWRVIYTAGYREVPEAIQEACARWAASSKYLIDRDPSVIFSSTTGYQPPTGIPDIVKQLLRPFRRHW